MDTRINNFLSFYVGIKDAFYKISSREGMRSLWSGLSPTLVLAVPGTIVYFVCYEEFRLKCKDYYLKMRPNHTEQHFAIPLLSGVVARVISVSVVSPLELIRTKMQSQKLSYYGMQRICADKRISTSCSSFIYHLNQSRCRQSNEKYY